MNFEDVKELIKVINSSSIDLFELNNQNFSVKISKNLKYNHVFSEKLEKDTINQSNVNAPITILPEEKSDVMIGNLIKSPIVGTFYSKREPNEPPFVKVGQRVSKGDVVCIIEAMKVMNEIVSSYDGEVTEVLVQDGEMVEFDQVIFKIS